MNEYFSNEWRNDFSPTDVYIKKNKKDKMLIIHKSVKNYIKERLQMRVTKTIWFTILKVH